MPKFTILLFLTAPVHVAGLSAMNPGVTPTHKAPSPAERKAILLPHHDSSQAVTTQTVSPPLLVFRVYEPLLFPRFVPPT